MIVKLMTEHHLEFLSFKGVYTDSSVSTLVKTPHCWKSHVMAHIEMTFVLGHLTKMAATSIYGKTKYMYV